jgi:hypothetical protein
MVASIAFALVLSFDRVQVQELRTLVESLSPEVRATVESRRDGWVAGQKATLIGEGEGFVTKVSRLTESPWNFEPERMQSFDDTPPFLADYAAAKDCGKVLVALAYALDEGGNPDEAARVMLVLRQLYSRWFEGNIGLTGHLVGSALVAMAEKTTRTLVAKGSVSIDGLKSLQGSVGDPDFEAFVEVLNREQDMNTIPNFGSLTGEGYDRGSTVDFLKRWFGAARESAQIGGKLEKADQLKRAFLGDVPKDDSQRKAYFSARSNGLGQARSLESIEIFEQAYATVRKNAVERSLTAIVVASQRALKESGKLPADLAGLEAFGLPRGLVDFYSGGSFGYDAARQIAWSAGLNGKDDGGKSEPEQLNKSADYIVRLRF